MAETNWTDLNLIKFKTIYYKAFVDLGFDVEITENGLLINGTISISITKEGRLETITFTVENTCGYDESKPKTIVPNPLVAPERHINPDGSSDSAGLIQAVQFMYNNIPNDLVRYYTSVYELSDISVREETIDGEKFMVIAHDVCIFKFTHTKIHIRERDVDMTLSVPNAKRMTEELYVWITSFFGE